MPWDSGTLKPLFEELVPALEKADVASLKKRAEKISPDLVLLVETDGKWSEPAKTSILSAAPQVAAKWLNASGISAENQGEVVLAIAAISILTSRSLLIGKLDQMAAKNTVKLPVAPEAKP